MNKKEEYEKRILEAVYKNYDICVMDDGFYYYWGKDGALSSLDLRIIADELDKKNEKWKQSIKDYFEQI